MEHSLTAKLEVKDLTDQGTFSGRVAVFGNKDAGNDVILPGSFRKTLSDNGGKVPLFLNHSLGDLQSKVGVVHLQETKDALQGQGVLNLNTTAGREAQAILAFDQEHGLKSALSFGFKSIRDTVKDGVRYLSEIQIFEASLVSIGMNDMAYVTSAKSRDEQLRALLEQARKAFQWDGIAELRSQLRTASAAIDARRRKK